jgi:hypothetical protein
VGLPKAGVCCPFGAQASARHHPVLPFEKRFPLAVTEKPAFDTASTEWQQLLSPQRPYLSACRLSRQKNSKNELFTPFFFAFRNMFIYLSH